MKLTSIDLMNLTSGVRAARMLLEDLECLVMENETPEFHPTPLLDSKIACFETVNRINDLLIEAGFIEEFIRVHNENDHGRT